MLMGQAAWSSTASVSPLLVPLMILADKLTSQMQELSQPFEVTAHLAHHFSYAYAAPLARVLAIAKHHST